MKKIFHAEIPFYPQKWDLTKWKELGFKSYEDAEYWERSVCGALCLKMAVDAFLFEQGRPLSPSINGYIEKGVEIKAYEDAVGWWHAGLVRLGRIFADIPSATYRKCNTGDVKKFLDKGNLPIISVRVAFKKRKKSLREKIFFWKRLAGHLALAVGYEEESGKVTGFYVNHTSIRPDYNWNQRFIPIVEFEQGFTGNCIVVGEGDKK